MLKLIIFALLLSGCSAVTNITYNPNDGTITQDKRVFVTSTTQLPQGSLSAMDTVCQNRANAANLLGTWKAWLSDSTTNAKDRITDSGPWHLVSGPKVANNISDLTDGTLNAPINRNEFGSVVSTVEVFTGTFYNGLKTTETCNNWASNSGTDLGSTGTTNQSNQSWSQSSSNYCNTPSPIYCFEQ